jgi:hypothetical protein
VPRSTIPRPAKSKRWPAEPELVLDALFSGGAAGAAAAADDPESLGNADRLSDGSALALADGAGDAEVDGFAVGVGAATVGAYTSVTFALSAMSLSHACRPSANTVR